VWRKTVLWNPNVLLFNTKLRLSQKCTGIKLGFVSWHISENQIAITKILYFWSALTASLVLLYSISLSLSLPLSLSISLVLCHLVLSRATCRCTYMRRLEFKSDEGKEVRVIVVVLILTVPYYYCWGQGGIVSLLSKENTYV